MHKVRKILFLATLLILIILVVLPFYFLRGRQKITILYTTDLQGFITPHEHYWSKNKPLVGGSAYLATYIKREGRYAERKNNTFILLDTGNFFAGQAEGYFFKGSSIIEIMNSLGYDAMSIGPKDFAFGEENIRNLVKLASFPFLSANIVDEATLELVDYIRPFIIKEHRGIKIGIIGITTPQVQDYVFPENIRGLKFLDPVLVVQEYISQFKKAGVRLIIVLSNLGLEEDKRLAQKAKGIDVIIGGNDMPPWREPIYIEPHNRTIIAQTWEKGACYYGVDIILDRKGKVIKYKHLEKDLNVLDIKPDREIEALVKKYINLVENKKKEWIGYAQLDLTRSIDQESNLGNWVADVLREKTKTDIALVGGLRADLKQGEITIGDVYSILPIIDRLEVFGFNLAVLELTGEQIREMLEVGVSYGLEKGEGILQVSGLQYSYDLKRRKWDRVVEIMVGGEELDLDKVYRVAVNSYLASGLGGYYILKAALKRYDTGLMDFDVLVEYIKTHSPITALSLEERIVRVE